MAWKLGLFLMCLLLVGCAEEKELDPNAIADTNRVDHYTFIETELEIGDYIDDSIIRDSYRIIPIEDPCPPCPELKAKTQYDHMLTKCNGTRLRLPEGSLYGAIIEERGDGWWLQLRNGRMFCVQENPLPFLD